MQDVFIVGCGGHGRVILDTLLSVAEACGNRTPAKRKARSSSPGFNIAFLDDDPAMCGKQVQGVPVLGGTDLIRAGMTVYLGIGDNIRRRDLYLMMKRLGCELPSLVSPTAIVSRAARIDDGAVILARAIIQTGAHVHSNAIINTAALVEHDCLIAPHVQLAPMVALSGRVRIGEGTLLGTGTSVNVGVSIGKYCLVSPGIPVIRDLPDYTVLKVNSAGYRIESNRRISEI
jgi:UDP-perosamine 4-acetyltransferase